MVVKFGKPCLFITFTCNPKHQDIESNLGNSGYPVNGGASSVHRVNSSARLYPTDRPDIVSAAFKLHLDEFERDLKFCFGEQEAISKVIEFQKRGLPHTHLALWLKEGYKFRNPEDIDKFIRAELPDPDSEPELFELVTKLMIHECSISRCMQDGNCSKQFPKAFSNETSFNDKGIQYRRPKNGPCFVKNGNTYDNRHVVPYSPYLLYKYRSHINVEACMSVSSIKYLFKYIHKGYDAAFIEKQAISRNQVDEIQEYMECRYVSAQESIWRIREFPLSNKSHVVVRLQVHLENKHAVIFRENEDPEDVLDRDSGSTLTRWFDLNRNDISAKQYLYTEIPYYYKYVLYLVAAFVSFL